MYLWDCRPLFQKEHRRIFLFFTPKKRYIATLLFLSSCEFERFSWNLHKQCSALNHLYSWLRFQVPTVKAIVVQVGRFNPFSPRWICEKWLQRLMLSLQAPSDGGMMRPWSTFMDSAIIVKHAGECRAHQNICERSADRYKSRRSTC